MMPAVLDHDKKEAYLRFTIKYNLLLLGGLYILLLGIAICHLSDKTDASINVWSLLFYLITLIISLFAWIYCIRRSWQLTEFDAKLRIATLAYLFGTPIILLLISGRIISVMLQFFRI